MAKSREIYVCQACGAESLQWQGKCPSCQAWNTLSLFREPKNVNAPRKKGKSEVWALQDVPSDSHHSFSCGFPALDRVLGQGMVLGGAYLIGGEPGIGKSTLLLQIAGNVAKNGQKVLYASGEEALSQIRLRASRLNMLHDNLFALATTHLDDIIEALEEMKPSLVIVDSVQTISSSRAEGLSGNANQIRAVTNDLIEICRKLSTTLILVGHVTKDGVLAGPRLLEHMVDTVISLEGDRRQIFRLLRIFKNRFGATEELLVFRMDTKGLEVIDDPSTFFLEARDTSLSGAAVVMAVDGQRPLAVEVQALCTRSYLAIPRRTAVGFDVNRLHLLLAVLEKSVKVNFSHVDIYAKVGGGIKLQEPGLDLGVVAAILSSFYDVALPEKSIFWGEVDLNGQIRTCSRDSLRLSQAKRLQFSPLFYPVGDEKGGIARLSDLKRALFPNSDM